MRSKNTEINHTNFERNRAYRSTYFWTGKAPPVIRARQALAGSHLCMGCRSRPASQGKTIVSCSPYLFSAVANSRINFWETTMQSGTMHMLIQPSKTWQASIIVQRQISRGREREREFKSQPRPSTAPHQRGCSRPETTNAEFSVDRVPEE